MKTASATIQIDAPPMTVWSILTDLGRYGEWNPLFPAASGQVAPGNRITLKSVRPGNGRAMTVRPRIVAAEPGAELSWCSSLPGIIGGEHSYTLTPAGSGTRLVQSESFRGLLVPFAGKAVAGAEAGFQRVNAALKQRAEAIARDQRAP
ncbi:MAG TPA: SRPBCC domain-containing protein [Streptosporangiaceae bacterium]|nr:SRPBCC domain-containing protein [Streptosporangiaceae bacterium]